MCDGKVVLWKYDRTDHSAVCVRDRFVIATDLTGQVIMLVLLLTTMMRVCVLLLTTMVHVCVCCC